MVKVLERIKETTSSVIININQGTNSEESGFYFKNKIEGGLDFEESEKVLRYSDPELILYKIKEKEWIRLVGKERWNKLSPEKRNFLIKTAGIFNFDFKVNIKEAYEYYE